ncbi:hypothetical protein JW921_06990, partial [Candidatus Fermentibacterales bacterium]|nr:hypothetical protein [Candidatus Fermentibacterales bacterium]
DNLEGLTAGGTVPGDYTAVWEELTIRRPDTWPDGWDILLPDTLRVPGVEGIPGVWLWRSTRCNSIQHPGSTTRDHFIFYETLFQDPGLFEGDFYGHSGEVLWFFEESGMLVCAPGHLPTLEGYEPVRLSQEEMLETIRSWCPEMYQEEIAALWGTWGAEIEARCVEGGETLLLFPLNRARIESISELSFTPDQDLPVEYARLFLGLGAF